MTVDGSYRVRDTSVWDQTPTHQLMLIWYNSIAHAQLAQLLICVHHSYKYSLLSIRMPTRRDAQSFECLNEFVVIYFVY